MWGCQELFQTAGKNILKPTTLTATDPEVLSVLWSHALHLLNFTLVFESLNIRRFELIAPYEEILLISQVPGNRFAYGNLKMILPEPATSVKQLHFQYAAGIRCFDRSSSSPDLVAL